MSGFWGAAKTSALARAKKALKKVEAAELLEKAVKAFDNAKGAVGKARAKVALIEARTKARRLSRRKRQD